MKRATTEQRLIRCQAQNYRLMRLLAEHEIDLPGANGFPDMSPVFVRLPGESAEEEAERLRVLLAQVRGRLNMFAVRTTAHSWSAEARSIIKVIDRAERRYNPSEEVPHAEQ